MVIFGLGCTGTVALRLFAAAGWAVHGTVRTEADRERVLADLGGAVAGVHVFDGDGTDALPESLRAVLPDATHVLATAQPLKTGGLDPVLPALAAAKAGGLLGNVRWVGYLSTSGVYGDHDGGWVDESDAPRPRSPRATRRVMCEAAWLRSGLPVHVFRLPGIYGPNKGVLPKVRAGKARVVVKPRQYFSRVHAADVAGALLASAIRPTADPSRPFCGDAAVFNVADDHPGPQGPVIAFACDLLGVERPAPELFADAAPGMSAMGRSFYAESRRVSSRRIRDVLGFRPAFPGYREGLEASLKEEAEAEAAELVVVARGVRMTPTSAAAARHHMGVLGISDEGDASPAAPPRVLAPGTNATSVEACHPSPSDPLVAPAAGPGPRPWAPDPFAAAEAALPGRLDTGRGVQATLEHIATALRSAVRVLGPPVRPREGAAGPGREVAPWNPGAGVTAIVVDNGSKSPGATLALRRVCRALWDRYGVRAVPASARFSDTVDPATLGGRRGETLRQAMVRTWGCGPGRRIAVVPLFFGPSATVTGWIPKEAQAAAEESEAAGVEPGPVVIAPPLTVPSLAEASRAAWHEGADVEDPEAAAASAVRALTGQAEAEAEAEAACALRAAALDELGAAGVAAAPALPSVLVGRASPPARLGGAAAAVAGPTGRTRLHTSGVDVLALALADRVQDSMGPGPAGRVRVLLCEHGSPSRIVHAVRPVMAARLRTALAARGLAVADVVGCAMERRDGPRFAFSEPMLETALPAAVAAAEADGPGARVVVALLFALPGKHAGPGGDVATIATAALGLSVDGFADEADPHRAALRAKGVEVTDVLGEHPAVQDLLWQRLRVATAAAGWC